MEFGILGFKDDRTGGLMDLRNSNEATRRTGTELIKKLPRRFECGLFQFRIVLSLILLYNLPVLEFSQ